MNDSERRRRLLSLNLRRVGPNRRALIREALARWWSGQVASSMFWNRAPAGCLIPVAASQGAESGDPSNTESTRTPNADRSGKTAIVRDPWGAHNHRRRRLLGLRSRAYRGASGDIPFTGLRAAHLPLLATQGRHYLVTQPLAPRAKLRSTVNGETTADGAAKAAGMPARDDGRFATPPTTPARLLAYLAYAGVSRLRGAFTPLGRQIAHIAQKKRSSHVFCRRSWFPERPWVETAAGITDCSAGADKCLL
jgi:hypothetical protein